MTWPNSIREINELPINEKHEIYKTLLPEWLFSHYGASGYITKLGLNDAPVVRFRCPSGSRAMELIVKKHASDLDPILYLNLADTFNNQLLVLLVVVNDPDARRYNTDVDQHGNPTHYGTSSRNIPAEIEAMKAGLAPGQVRKGLRVFRQSVPMFETFVSRMGHSMFLIEPLAYHNAIVFERYGFNYIRGYREMLRINTEFHEGGELHEKLTDNSPFRSVDAWKSVRGRSWAIHDGILGHPFTGFQMYKQVGKNAGINTFPGAAW